MAKTRLAKRMRAQSMSATGLAHYMGVGYSTVRAWMADTREPGVRNAQSVAKLLHTTVAKLWPLGARK